MDKIIILKTAEIMDKMGEYKLADKLTKTAILLSPMQPQTGLWGKDETLTVTQKVDRELITRANNMSTSLMNATGQISDEREEDLIANLKTLREPLTIIFKNDINTDVSNMDGDEIKRIANGIVNPFGNDYSSYIDLEPTVDESQSDQSKTFEPNNII
jgi:dsDNA-binding SOS-regulon protein